MTNQEKFDLFNITFRYEKADKFRFICKSPLFIIQAQPPALVPGDTVMTLWTDRADGMSDEEWKLKKQLAFKDVWMSCLVLDHYGLVMYRALLASQPLLKMPPGASFTEADLNWLPKELL